MLPMPNATFKQGISTQQPLFSYITWPYLTRHYVLPKLGGEEEEGGREFLASALSFVKVASGGPRFSVQLRRPRSRPPGNKV